MRLDMYNDITTALGIVSDTTVPIMQAFPALPDILALINALAEEVRCCCRYSCDHSGKDDIKLAVCSL
jgi:hypothetical protein